MGCGCGKGREGTAAVKDRKRSGASTINSLMTGQTSAPINDAGYNKRASDYRQTLREYVNRGR